MTVKTPGRVHATLITDRRELAPGVVVLGFDAAELVRDARPGQYLMAIPPSGEACATALGIYEAEGRRASILFFVTGKRTRELAELRPGDRLDVLGPLGNGFDLSGGARDVAIVAGGVGLASVLLPAQWLVRAGARVRLFYGARSAKLLVDAKRFSDAGCEVLFSTDDGSAGHYGFITDLLARAAGRQLPDLSVRSVADVARGRARRDRTRRPGATQFGRNVRVRRRRMLGMCGPARTGERASARVSRCRSRRQRRRQRAHL